jgi:putative tryptophan/tyrosine transport system substrate-binding protein
MKRREFLATLGGAATWPLAARAQQPALPVIGFLSSGSASTRADQVSNLFGGLKEAGFVEGETVAVLYRWADEDYGRLPGLAADLVRSNVSVIAATGGPVTALAAKNATSTIPIVFTAVSDPLSYGLVASFNRPGGNVTGTGGYVAELDAKRLELIRETVRSADRVGVLVNPNRPHVDRQIDTLRTAASDLKHRLVVLRAGSVEEIDTVFADLSREPVEALVVAADPFFSGQRDRLVSLAARYRVPAIYQWREFPASGGLMSYGPSVASAYYQAGTYVARILKGAKPAELPVLQPTKFELVINLKTAKALGLEIAPTLLARADEVIE